MSNNISEFNFQFVLSILFIIFFALIYRVFFYSGIFGSDDYDYIMRANDLKNGFWGVTSYIADNRYFVNGSLALSFLLFGVNEFSANVPNFICSILEIIFVFVFVYKYINYNSALFTAIIMSIVPGMVYSAGSLQADSILSFFITSSFIIFLFGVFENKNKYLFYAGILSGIVFLVKEMAIFYILGFLPLFLYLRLDKKSYVIFALGGFLVLVINLLFFYIIANDPLFIFKNAFSFIDGYNLNSSDAKIQIPDESLSFYFQVILNPLRFLLLPVFSIIFLVCVSRDQFRKVDAKVIWSVVVWFFSMIFLFSFLVISVSPITFISKQINYSLVFVPPLSILSGCCLAFYMNKIYRIFSIMLMFVLSVVGSTLYQASIQTYTINSKYMYQYIYEHPEVDFYVSYKNLLIIQMISLFETGAVSIKNVHKLTPPLCEKIDVCDLKKSDFESKMGVIIDTEVLPSKVTPIHPTEFCLQKLEKLSFNPEFPYSYRILSLLKRAASYFPQKVRSPIERKLDQYLISKPVYIFP